VLQPEAFVEEARFERAGGRAHRAVHGDHGAERQAAGLGDRYRVRCGVRADRHEDEERHGEKPEDVSRWSHGWFLSLECAVAGAVEINAGSERQRCWHREREAIIVYRILLIERIREPGVPRIWPGLSGSGRGRAGGDSPVL